MEIRDEFKSEHIHAYQLADFAKTCGIDKKLLSRMLTPFPEKTLTTLRNNLILDEIASDERFSTQDFPYLKTLSDNIINRAEIVSIQV